MNLDRDELYCRKGIFIARSDIHRWGIFTKKKIKQYDVIQESPYCTFPEKELKKADVIQRYSYSSDGWDERVNECVIGFGFAPLYNHSEEANCAYELDTINEVMRHYALEDIPAWSELTLDYGCGEWGEDDY